MTSSRCIQADYAEHLAKFRFRTWPLPLKGTLFSALIVLLVVVVLIIPPVTSTGSIQARYATRLDIAKISIAVWTVVVALRYSALLAAKTIYIDATRGVVSVLLWGIPLRKFQLDLCKIDRPKQINDPNSASAQIQLMKLSGKPGMTFVANHETATNLEQWAKVHDIVVVVSKPDPEEIGS